MFSGSFTWQFAVPLLRVGAASVSEQRDRGLFSTYVLATLTLFLVVLLNPAASGDVRPTPSVPALTSRAGASLSFESLISPAASHPARSEALALSLVAPVPWLTASVCFLAGAGPGVCPLPRASGYHFLAPEWGGSLPLPFIFRYLCVVSRLPVRTSVLSAGDVHL